MYKAINSLDKILVEANKFVLQNDRELYDPFMIAAEQFCRENNVLIGGAVGTDLLIGAPKTKDSYYLELYTDDTFVMAKKLTKRLYGVKSPHVDVRLVTLRTDIKHREFTVLVNLRQLIKVHNMDKYRGLKLYDLMGPASRAAHFTKEIVGLIPEEIQIIELYRALYSPGRFDQWEKALKTENILYNLVKETLGSKAALKVEVQGGAQPVNTFTLSKVLLRQLIPRSPYVLIGDYAMAEYAEQPRVARLQFLFDGDIEDLLTHVRKVISKEFPNVSPDSIIGIKYNVCLPTDFQLVKYTIYVQYEGRQESMADVYNSPSYELIPFRLSGGVRYAGVYAMLRFRFIEIWMLKLIANVDKKSADFLRGKIGDLVASVALLREWAARANPEDVFQLDNYYGIYRDEVVAKKKLLQRFAPYYPYLDDKVTDSSA